MAPNSPPAPPGARKATRFAWTSTRNRTRPGPEVSSSSSTAAGDSRGSRRSSPASGPRSSNFDEFDDKTPLTRGFCYWRLRKSSRNGLFALEGGLEQAELALDRVAAVDAAGNGRMDRGIE